MSISELEYYETDVETVCDELGIDPDEGLSEDEVARRQEEYGPNRIEMREPPSWLELFADHLTEFVSVLLIAVGTVALLTYLLGHGESISHLAEAIIIYAIVLINASVGAYQEHKSEQTAQTLQEMVTTETTVVRAGEYEEVDAETLVPGDVVELSSGDKVPADIRLVSVDELETQESVLTGESDAVGKQTGVLDEDRPLAERDNMAYMNTHVTRGSGRGVVVATGTATEAGSLAEASEESPVEEIPFVQEVSETGRTISKLALALVAVASIVFFIYGESLYQIFLLASALIIGSIPAALPVTVTYSLTNAAKKMAKNNVLIKNLPMIETLGGVDVVCTDKTGTLTKNEMAVKQWYVGGDTLEPEAIDREEHAELVRCAVTANEAETAKGDEGYIGAPEDVGLFEFVETLGEDPRETREEFDHVDFLAFSSERKQAQSLVRLDDRRVRYAKGAPEVILDRCDRIWTDGEVRSLTDEDREAILDAVHGFSEDALRNLAFSFKDVAEDEGVGVDTDGDVFLGVVGMWDPPKEGVSEAIQTLYGAGVDVKMITGDSRETAQAIATECGIDDPHTKTWEDIKDASDEEMEQIVQENNVFARMDPELKMEMVSALHRLDKRVAITGDGVNDTPPMEAAEVGVAMGDRGSDITRDVADILLLDDNFASITEGIRYGRTSLSNVRKVVNYLLTANLFEVVVLFISSFMGFTPFRALQLLWVNFATDIFPAIGLGGDPPHPDIMEKLPTGTDEKILNRRIWYMLAGIGLKKVGVVLLAFFTVLWLSTGSFTLFGITGNLAMAQTSAFVWLGLAHIDRIVAIRWDEGWKGMDLFINKVVNYSLLWPIASFLIILYSPLAGFFKAVPLPPWVWGLLGGPFLAFGILTAILVSKAVHVIEGDYGEREY